MRLKWSQLLVLGAILAFGLLTGGGRARADGGIFPPPNHYAWETEQKALIFYQNQTEDLFLSTSFQGESNEFVWVVPTPAQPRVAKSETKIFAALEKLTQIEEVGPPIVYDRAVTAMSGVAESAPVQVIEQKPVGAYDTVVLKATDDQALAKWLADNGYNYPGDKSSLLKEYVDQGWYFTVAKIRDALAENTEIKDKLSSGTLAPLRLTFATDKIVYPMRLTRLALEGATLSPPTIVPMAEEQSLTTEQLSPIRRPSLRLDITLYVLTDGRTQQSSLETQWANWIKTKDIESLNDAVNEANLFPTSQKLFLTKMESNVDTSEVEGDFIISRTSNNDVFPVPVWRTGDFWWSNVVGLVTTLLVALFSPLGLLFILAVVLQFATKKRWVYIVGLVYEVIACLGLIGAGLVFGLTGQSAITGTTSIIWESGFLGFILGLLLFLILGIRWTVKMIRHYKTTFQD